MTQQTQQDATELSTQQEQAMVLLLAGQSDAEVGAALGVDRSTVWRWRTGDPVFMAELNTRREALWGSYADRLRALLPAALQVLENTLENEPDAWRVALAVVRMADFGALAPTGPTDLDAIEREQRSARARAASAEQILQLEEMVAGV